MRRNRQSRRIDTEHVDTDEDGNDYMPIAASFSASSLCVMSRSPRAANECLGAPWFGKAEQRVEHHHGKDDAQNIQHETLVSPKLTARLSKRSLHEVELLIPSVARRSRSAKHRQAALRDIRKASASHKRRRLTPA